MITFSVDFIGEENVSGMPNGIPLETSSHKIRRRQVSPASEPDDKPPSKRPLRKTAITYALNYGSEEDSDEMDIGEDNCAISLTKQETMAYFRVEEDDDLLPAPILNDKLESTAEPTVPISSTAEPTVPISSTAEPTVPISSNAEPTALISSTEESPVSISSTAEPTVPISSTEEPTDPMSSTEEPTVPISSAEAIPSTQFEPIDLFKFEWRALPKRPLSPTERREVFSEIKCGPTARFRTPYDAFVAIWDPDFMASIARETNRYAQEIVEQQLQDGSIEEMSRITNWQDTNTDELYLYLAMLLATGMIVKSNIKDYWFKGSFLSTPKFAQHMSQQRFMLINRCLHFVPNSSHIIHLSRPKAKLYKIDPVLKHLNTKFQSLYRLGRNIAIDESLTQWKGWLDIKQYIKNKDTSVGIKIFEVCEAETGYLWRFKVNATKGREEMYEPKMTPVSEMVSLVPELLKGLEYTGRTVWMDKYFNSPPLARVLKSFGFDCVGTLQTNHRDVPRELATPTRSRMSIRQISSATSGDVDLLVWRNQNHVALLSTYHGAAVHTANGETEPIVNQDYKDVMRGVDKKDQILSMYPIERTHTQVWYKKLFRRLLNVSVLNAFILYYSDTRKHITNHHDFRTTLITQLFERHKTRPTLEPTGKTKASTGRKPVPNVPIIKSEVLNHFPTEYGLMPGSKKERIRRSCVVCHKRVQYYCSGCNVPLCIDCTKIYHK